MGTRYPLMDWRDYIQDVRQYGFRYAPWEGKPKTYREEVEYRFRLTKIAGYVLGIVGAAIMLMRILTAPALPRSSLSPIDMVGMVLWALSFFLLVMYVTRAGTYRR